MKISDIMSRTVEFIPANCTIQEAARKMRDLDVGALPIGENDRLQGMITDRDITIKATAQGLAPKTTEVRTLMSGPIVYCFEDQGVEDAVRMMEQRQVRRVVVLNRQKRLVGIVSLGDVATQDGKEGLVGQTLGKLSHSMRRTAA